MTGLRPELQDARTMRHRRGRANPTADHMPLHDERRAAASTQGRTSSPAHAPPSRCNLLPLIQLHRLAQLDLVDQGLQLRLGDRRPVGLEQRGEARIDASGSVPSGRPTLI